MEECTVTIPSLRPEVLHPLRALPCSLALVVGVEGVTGAALWPDPPQCCSCAGGREASVIRLGNCQERLRPCCRSGGHYQLSRIDANFWWRRIDPDHLRLMPTASASTPAEWMTLTGQLVDAGTVAADLNGLSAVALRWRHEPDTAVAVLIVVPAHKCCHPAAGACLAQVKSGGRPAGCRAWRSQPVSIAPAPVAAHAGHHYTCKEIGSYAKAQQPLRQGHA
jgi:hypothetical protein